MLRTVRTGEAIKTNQISEGVLSGLEYSTGAKVAAAYTISSAEAKERKCPLGLEPASIHGISNPVLNSPPAKAIKAYIQGLTGYKPFSV